MLNQYDEIQNAQFNEIKKDRSELRKAYFSSLQQGEWSAASDISPIEVTKHKSINETLHKHETTGKITAFAQSIFSKRLFVAGSKSGEILECDINSSKVRKYQLNSEILTLDICRDDSMWAAGTVNSEILIRKALGGWAKKTIVDFNSRPIIQIRFITKNCMLVATDRTVTRFKLTDMKLTYEVKYEPVTFEPCEVVQIMYMPMPEMRGNFVILTA